MAEIGKVINLTICSHLLVCHRAIMACWKGNQWVFNGYKPRLMKEEEYLYQSNT